MIGVLTSFDGASGKITYKEIAMFVTDNPYFDSCRHEAEQERAERDLPTCAMCGEPITDEFAYRIDGDLYCEECISSCRKAVC